MAFMSKTEVRPDTRLSPPLMHVFRTRHSERKQAAREEARRRSPAGQDEAPVSQRKIRPQRAPITERELKIEVERDIDSLMNHVSLDSSVDLEAFPQVRKSILNFGFPDVVHRSYDELDAFGLDRDILAALAQYEPRLAPGSVRVSRDASTRAGELELRYVVDGQLLCQPLNVPIEFLAKFDVATGKLKFVRR